ncbi:MAG: ATP-dependent zinc metalloprotease FtsH [Pseudomonadota bacterium]|nr:ATP-dependent zinc metalloprotease FtsH [Pseudomonadota bacterium]
MNMVRTLMLWAVIALIMVMVFNNMTPPRQDAEKVSYSHFIESVNNGQVREVSIADDRIITGSYSDNRSFTTKMPIDDQHLLAELMKKNVNVIGKETAQRGLLLSLFISLFPTVLLILFLVYIMRQMQGGGGKGGPMAFGRSRARMLTEDQVKVTFADVAGVEEAKEEVKELVDFLRDPGKFQKLGGKIPCGVLLVGSPGTGKTLLAKAVAGEAGVPFFTISGSDFVEMFVGVGASRVRDMFEQAKKHAPCIIFIDEIDAVGRHRGAGLGGGHDEREQTLNQLLVEMDGFEGKEGVIVVAATNRPDVLDPALLRPGRFDRQVVVPLPDIRGRDAILKVHMRKVPLEDNVSSNNIARGTPGFSGADLANLVNEAALFAARANKRKVGNHEFEQAKDKIMMGAERRSMVMNEEEKRLTAYHEAGHAIVGLSVPDHDPVYKVSIMPRGRALGVTMFLPEQDRYSYSLQRLESQIAGLFGGRVAEMLIFGWKNVTTGASNDIERATDIARSIVTKWGLSEKMGPLTYGEEEGQVFLGRDMNKRKDVSDATARIIDEEVRVIIDRNYIVAVDILREKIATLHLMADALIKYETIGEEQIADIMAGREARPPANWEDTENAPPTNPTNGQPECAADRSDIIHDKVDSNKATN